MPSYSPRAALALAYLKQPYNDVDVFVEDTGNHNMWLVLLKRILPARVRLQSVNLMGGREAVLKACKLDQADRPRRRLYIIDGDLDFLLGRTRPRLKFLRRLRAYCLENLLINENAIVQIGLGCRPNATEIDISRQFAFEQWLDATAARLRPLFALYAVSRALVPEIKTVGLPVEPLYTNLRSGVEIDPSKVFRRMLAVARQICARVGVRVFSRMKKKVIARLERLDHSRTISGKDYLLPALFITIRKRLNYNGTHDQLKVQLAASWPLHLDPGLVKAVQDLAPRSR